MLRIGGIGVGRVEAFLVDGHPELGEAGAIDRPELGLHVVVVDEHEPPVLGVAAARCPDRSIEDALLHVVRDGVGEDPSHRAGRVQGLVDVHDVSLAHFRRAARRQLATGTETGGARLTSVYVMLTWSCSPPTVGR